MVQNHIVRFQKYFRKKSDMISTRPSASRNPSALSDSTEDGKENDAESGNMPGLACMDSNSSLPVKIDVNGWLRVFRLYQCIGQNYKIVSIHRIVFLLVAR